MDLTATQWSTDQRERDVSSDVTLGSTIRSNGSNFHGSLHHHGSLTFVLTVAWCLDHDGRARALAHMNPARQPLSIRSRRVFRATLRQFAVGVIGTLLSPANTPRVRSAPPWRRSRIAECVGQVTRVGGLDVVVSRDRVLHHVHHGQAISRCRASASLASAAVVRTVILAGSISRCFRVGLLARAILRQSAACISVLHVAVVDSADHCLSLAPELAKHDHQVRASELVTR